MDLPPPSVEAHSYIIYIISRYYIYVYIKQVEALVGLPQPSVEALPCRFQAPLHQVRPMNPMFCFVFSTFLFLNVYTPIFFPHTHTISLIFPHSSINKVKTKVKTTSLEFLKRRKNFCEWAKVFLCGKTHQSRKKYPREHTYWYGVI